MVVNDCGVAKTLPEQSVVEKSYASDVECYGTEQERLELINLIHMEGLIVGEVIDVDKTGEITISNQIKHRSVNGLLDDVLQADYMEPTLNKHFYSSSVLEYFYWVVGKEQQADVKEFSFDL